MTKKILHIIKDPSIPMESNVSLVGQTIGDAAGAMKRFLKAAGRSQTCHGEYLEQSIILTAFDAQKFFQGTWRERMPTDGLYLLKGVWRTSSLEASESDLDDVSVADVLPPSPISEMSSVQPQIDSEEAKKDVSVGSVSDEIDQDAPLTAEQPVISEDQEVRSSRPKGSR